MDKPHHFMAFCNCSHSTVISNPTQRVGTIVTGETAKTTLGLNPYDICTGDLETGTHYLCSRAMFTGRKRGP